MNKKISEMLKISQKKKVIFIFVLEFILEIFAKG